MTELRLRAARSFLRRRGWLGRTPPRFADALLSRCAFATVQRGACVYRMGDPPDGLRGVVTGGFAFQIAPYERGPHLAHIFRPGFWFGEAEMFDGRPKVASIVAARPSSFLHLPQAELSTLMEREPETWRWLGQLGADHLELAIGIIDDTTLREPGARVIAILLRLAGYRTHDLPEERQPEIDVTQADLAHLATVSRGTVSAKLDALEREGLIRRAYGCVTLLEPARLRARIASASALCEDDARRSASA